MAFLFLTLTLYFDFAKCESALVSGGLLFHKLSETERTINPATVIFHRLLNFSHVTQSVELSRVYLKEYQTLCEKLNQHSANENQALDEDNDFVLSDNKEHVIDAESYCLSRGFRLPEIRNMEQYSYVQKLMALENITTVRAGIIRDQNSKFVFKSDLQDISWKRYSKFFPYVRSYWNEKANFHWDTYANEDAKTQLFAYVLSNRGFEIEIISQSWTRRLIEKIICEKKRVADDEKRVENSILSKIAAHSCLRDMRSLIGTHNIIANELQLFVKSANKFKIDDLLADGYDAFERKISAGKEQLVLSDTQICKPEFDPRCTSDFMSFINFVQKECRRLAKEVGVKPNLLTVYVLLDVLKSNNAIRNNTNFDGCHTRYSYVDKIGSNQYLIRAFEIFLDTCIVSNQNQFDVLTKSKLSSQSIVEASKKFSAEFKSIFSDHKRKKRFAQFGIPLAIALGTNTINSFTTGAAPFSWFGEVIGKTTGLVTHSDIKITMDTVKYHSEALKNLSISQMEISRGYADLRSELLRLRAATQLIEISAINLFAEFDNKMILRQLHNIIQLVNVKMATAVSEARRHHTSPFAFAQGEISAVAAKYRERNIRLSENVNDIYTSVIMDGDNILFVFEIPILDDRTKFYLYSVTPLPLYTGDDGVISEIDADYIGISQTNSEYTILNARETQDCLKEQFCVVPDAIRQIESSNHCVIKSFQSNVYACDLKPLKTKNGFYELHGTQLIYSTPNATEIKLICKDAETGLFEHTSMTISGVGNANVKPDCQIIIPGGRRIYSNPIPTVEKLQAPNFMKILEYLPEMDNFTLVIRDQANDNYTELIRQATHKAVSLLSIPDTPLEHFVDLPQFAGEVGRAFMFIALIVFFLILPCCSEKYRTWWKTWLLCANPYKWLTVYQGVHLPTWTKRSKTAEKAKEKIARADRKNQKILDEISKNTVATNHNPNVELLAGKRLSSLELRDQEENPYTFPRPNPVLSIQNTRQPSSLEIDIAALRPERNVDEILRMDEDDKENPPPNSSSSSRIYKSRRSRRNSLQSLRSPVGGRIQRRYSLRSRIDPEIAQFSSEDERSTVDLRSDSMSVRYWREGELIPEQGIQNPNTSLVSETESEIHAVGVTIQTQTDMRNTPEPLEPATAPSNGNYLEAALLNNAKNLQIDTNRIRFKNYY